MQGIVGYSPPPPKNLCLNGTKEIEDKGWEGDDECTWAKEEGGVNQFNTPVGESSGQGGRPYSLVDDDDFGFDVEFVSQKDEEDENQTTVLIRTKDDLFSWWITLNERVLRFQ